MIFINCLKDKIPTILFFWFSFYFCIISVQSPFGVQRQIYTTEGRSPELCGWMDGWVGGWAVIFYPLRFRLYFQGIQMRYIYTCIYSQKLSPRLLWVSKLDFKMGVGGHEIQNYPIMVPFRIFDVKSVFFCSLRLKYTPLQRFLFSSIFFSSIRFKNTPVYRLFFSSMSTYRTCFLFFCFLFVSNVIFN